ncbi:hypothetical protein F4859DRAFT_520171 [Xylaria cf. heliscus]|nr:hypothetical protein F4859DRAFT_520171 [Xylaria cf. heliscus]
MLKLLIFGLVLFHAICVSVDIGDLFTIQAGPTNGGCDTRLNPANILDAWHQESIDSIVTAINAIEKYNEDSRSGERVRDALFDFFGIPTLIPKDTSKLKSLVQKVSDNLKHVEEWLSGENKGVSKASTYLFCDSTFLVQKDPTIDVALDYKGYGIIVNGDLITISSVGVYAKDLRGGRVPWWSGDRTDVNGYYFTLPNSGGNFCSGENFGLTATLRALEQKGDGAKPVISSTVVNNVILCPSAFDNPTQKNSYTEAVATIREGTSLEDVVPKSTNLLHEAFHLVLGAGPTGFLEGPSEFYKLAECLDAATIDPTKVARRNPENYVFFIMTMYYLFGDREDGVITTNWDFTNGPGMAKSVS